MLHVKSQQNKIWLGVAAAALGSFALVGCGGGEDQSQAPAPQSSGGAGAGPGGGPGLQMGSGGGGGMPGAAPQGQQQVATAPAPKLPGPPGARPDPFKPWFNTIPPPPPAISLVEPVRIAMTGTTLPIVQPGVEIQEVPSRRVAGILTGNGVYALLDGGPNGPEVVKPGQLLDDGYMVAMINANSVTLRKKVASQTYTQVVPLTDAGSTTSVGAPGGFRQGAGPGFGPGFGRPGGAGGPRIGGASGAGSASGN